MSFLSAEISARFANVIRSPELLDAEQWGAVDFLRETPNGGLIIPLGKGKTIICLTLLDQLMMEFGFHRALVIAPLRVAAQTWPTEIAEWAHTAYLDYTLIRAEDDDDEVIATYKAAYASAYEEARSWPLEPKLARQIAGNIAGRARTEFKEQVRQRKAMANTSVHIIDDAHVDWLINFHSTFKRRMVRGVEKRVRSLKTWPYDVIIRDESSRDKDHNTNRFKALKMVRSRLKRYHPLTATPAAEHYMGLFAQTFLQDSGERFGRAITPFREKYFSYNQYKRSYTLLPGGQDAIAEKIADINLVIPESTEHQPVYLHRRFDLNAEQKEMHDRFLKDFILEFEDGEDFEALTAADLSGKLLQLASGAIYRSVDKMERMRQERAAGEIAEHLLIGNYKVFHEQKIEELRELKAELLGQPLLIGYWFKSSLDRIKKAFPKAVEMDTGGKLVKPWNEGKIDMMLMHPAGSAYGLNLQYGPGHDIAYFDIPWSNELYKQFNGRLARRGQKQQVRVHHIMARGTKDEFVEKRLRTKEDAQVALLNNIRALRKKFAARKRYDGL